MFAERPMIITIIIWFPKVGANRPYDPNVKTVAVLKLTIHSVRILREGHGPGWGKPVFVGGFGLSPQEWKNFVVVPIVGPEYIGTLKMNGECRPGKMFTRTRWESWGGVV